MNKWQRHLVVFVLIMLGGVSFYIALQNVWWKGLLLALGSILIHLGMDHVNKIWQDHKEEIENGNND